MNWIDIVLLLIVGFSAIKGLRDGLIKQASGLLAIIVAIFASGYITTIVEKILTQIVHLSPQMGHIVGLALSFLLIIGAISLAGYLVSKFVSHTPLAIFNRIGGLTIGLIAPLIVLSYLFLFIDSVTLPRLLLRQMVEKEGEQPTPDIREESYFYYPIKSIVPTFIAPRLLEKEDELRENYNDNSINERKQDNPS